MKPAQRREPGQHFDGRPFHEGSCLSNPGRDHHSHHPHVPVHNHHHLSRNGSSETPEKYDVIHG